MIVQTGSVWVQFNLSYLSNGCPIGIHPEIPLGKEVEVGWALPTSIPVSTCRGTALLQAVMHLNWVLVASFLARTTRISGALLYRLEAGQR
ncbi:hypothetical protein [Coleofasciculus sp. F4-SAH-05]|uniref:hypothetical protein n=1 Tax=Coleofasciculus sp. F4-SAH-05 TaxID=3069525 RepID=UPI0032F29448